MRVKVPSAVTISLASVFVWTAACVPFPGNTAPAGNVAIDIRAEPIVAQARIPTALAFASDGRVFYCEKNTGNIRVIVDDTLMPEPVATVPVNAAGERGVLGIALHPDFNNNHRLYIFYSRSDTGSATTDPRALLDFRVVYFTLDGNTTDGGEVFVASISPSNVQTRLGGRLLFTPDARLIVSVGDEESAAAPQNPRDHRGKLLRYTDNGAIPAINPDPASPVFALGFRNVTGLALDSDGLRILALDQNPGGHDEIDNARSGRNYGWPGVDGAADTTAEKAFVEGIERYSDPLLELAGDPVGRAGLTLNPSTRYGPDLEGRLFFGLPSKGAVQMTKLNSGRTDADPAENFLTGFRTRITDVAFTPAGTLYVATVDAIYRITPTR